MTEIPRSQHIDNLKRTLHRRELLHRGAAIVGTGAAGIVVAGLGDLSQNTLPAEDAIARQTASDFAQNPTKVAQGIDAFDRELHTRLEDSGVASRERMDRRAMVVGTVTAGILWIVNRGVNTSQNNLTGVIHYNKIQLNCLGQETASEGEVLQDYDRTSLKRGIMTTLVNFKPIQDA